MLSKVTDLNVQSLRNISNSEETELCRIMNFYGSDKGNGHHNYTKLYYGLFSDIRNEKLNILEIGIGSINPGITSNMCGCRNYKPGASQFGWKEFFPNAKIYGCDIDKDILNFNDERITGFYMDQRDIQGIVKTFYLEKLRNIKFDIIIDDGLHVFDVNWSVMKVLLPKLNDKGIYIIEDLLDYNPDITEDLRGVYWKYIQLPNHHNVIDNNLIIAVKE